MRGRDPYDFRASDRREGERRAAGQELLEEVGGRPPLIGQDQAGEAQPADSVVALPGAQRGGRCELTELRSGCERKLACDNEIAWPQRGLFVHADLLFMNREDTI